MERLDIFDNKYCGLKFTVFENPEKFVSQISGTQEMLSAFLRELSWDCHSSAN